MAVLHLNRKNVKDSVYKVALTGTWTRLMGSSMQKGRGLQGLPAAWLAGSAITNGQWP